MRSRSVGCPCIYLFIFVILLVFLDTGNAATTGKISGKVSDEDGRPVPGAAVTVLGTRLGALSDAQGRYFILQVPPGSHVVQAQLIGYRPVRVTNVDVNADLTTEIDFRLPEAAIEMESMVVTAERPEIETDVTASQAIVDADRVGEMPVTQMLDMLSYEPGVSVARDNELEIRGGGPSEIRFQIDGTDRTDPLTSKARTQLNQMLVSEVTVLTGGFNAEYGNVRSGMINAVLKDGTERGFGLPWIAGAISYRPAQKKHFGPGGYDEDQYDYRIMSSRSPLDTLNLRHDIHWPQLYEETRDDEALLDQIEMGSTQFRIFRGWEYLAQSANVLAYDAAAGEFRGAYGKNDWTPEELREAWEYEANMNEVAWQYSDEPDIGVDLAAGWAFPARIGGIVVGYSYSKEMTAVPALLPYYLDKTIEAKLTLTPTDNLRMSVRYMKGESESTGGGYLGTNAYTSPELSSTGVGQLLGNDPAPLRSFSQLVSSVSATTTGNNTKLHMSFNEPLYHNTDQYSATLTYALSAATFVNVNTAWSSTEWDMVRDLPRADITDFDAGEGYKPPAYFNYRSWLDQAFSWSDIDGDGRGDPPVDLDDALAPGRMQLRGPYSMNAFYEVPTETKYITHEFHFEGDDEPTIVVSPQGWIQEKYSDLSGTYSMGGGAEINMHANSSQMLGKFDITHSTGSHTFKAGAELMRSELEYDFEKGALMVSPRNYASRHYGGKWSAPTPTYLGVFAQDKYESEGMIMNFGVRVERFDGGDNALMYDDLFNNEVLVQHMNPTRRKLQDSLGYDPMPWEIYDEIPQSPSVPHWRVGPRAGVSHPVSDRTKFFFNFGIFYSMQKATVMYGYSGARMIGNNGGISHVFNPNLRPAKTTMYEVGFEHVLPLNVVTTIRGFAKYNEDQVGSVSVWEASQGGSYTAYRNVNYETIRGLEIRLSRSSGRFVNGWFTYERSASQTGNIGFLRIHQDPNSMDTRSPWHKVHVPNAFFRGAVVLGTPADWGIAAGKWRLSIIQSYQSGGEVVYNPDALELREVPEDNFIPVADYHNTDLKLSKSFGLPGSRSLMLYVDVTNVWNAKRLNGSGISDINAYKKYLVQRRQLGSDVEYGGESTFSLFSRPYRDADGNWKAPISPRTEWLHHVNPRSYALGIRFNL